MQSVKIQTSSEQQLQAIEQILEVKQVELQQNV